MLAHDVVRRRVEAQGFRGLDDTALTEVGPWLRWSPAVCAVFMAAGTILASAAMLWTLATIALLGALMPMHPFDVIYNHAVRYLTGTRPLPHHGAQRRFACAVGAAWLAATGLAFHQGWPVLGYALGGALTVVATLAATTHFCIASFIYNAVLGRAVGVSAARVA